MLSTEQNHPSAIGLDQMPTQDLIAAFAHDQWQALQAVKQAQAQLAQAVKLAVPRMRDGGRLIYVGAGTSGRLALLDSVELNPTFSWPPERALCLLAGGSSALQEAVEGAEDDADAARLDLLAVQPMPQDVVIGIAASGRTPYTLSALETAIEIGCLCIAIVNNLGSPMHGAAHVCIELETGPELISGSTRLKAGTAQKIALNTFSSALMVQLNKVHEHWMVDLRVTNQKLFNRAVSIVGHIAGCDSDVASAMLKKCDTNIKTAVVALVCELTPHAAQTLLREHNNDLRSVLQQHPASSRI